MLLVAAMLSMEGDRIMGSKHTYALMSRTCESFYLARQKESKAVDELRC